MFNSLFILIVLCRVVFAAIIANSQSLIKTVLDPPELVNILKSLDKNIDNTTRVDNLLLLAEYYLWKEGGNRVDLNRSAGFIQQVNELNAKFRSPKLMSLSFASNN